MNNITSEEQTNQYLVKKGIILDSGKRLLVLLQRKNLKQSDLSAKIGYSRQYINGIIHNRIIPSTIIKKKIVTILECDTIDIWGNKNEE
ncbi:MAG: helix-turn-helix transcriptional regulator [Candidatus Nanoarchaeia archaeon]